MPRKTKRGSGRAVGRSRRAAVRGKHNPRSMKAAGACNPLDRHMASLLDYNVRLAAVKLDSPPTLEWVRGVASEISTKRVPSKAQLESAFRSAVTTYEWARGRSHNPGASTFTEIGYYDAEGTYRLVERLPHGTSDSDAWLRAQRVSRELGHPVQLVGRGAPVTVSAGGVTVENPDSPDYTSMTDAQHARNFGRREAGASLNHDVARWKFAHDSYRKWLRLYVDKNLWPQLEDEWRAGYAEEMEERGHNPAGDPEDHKSAGYLGTIMASLASEGQFYDVMREHHGLSFFLKRHDDGDLTAKVRDMHQVQQGPEVVVPPDQIQDVYHYALHHGTMEGWEPGGVGRRDNPDEESVCIEDFCGSDEMGPTSFSADYFPHDGLTYFTGDWRSGVDIPPMPSPMQPTLRKVYEWAYQHGSDMKPWEGMENPRHMPPFRPGIDRVGSFHPRFVQESQMAELANLWHTSSTLYPGRYERMQWTSKWFAKEHPELTSTAVYKDLDAWLGFNRMGNPAASPEQYRLAQAVLSGTARSHMPESVAREIVERTPAGLRSEYSRYNPEPVTSSGKTIPLLKSGTYQDRQRWPKYTTAISPSHPVASGSAAGKMLADRLPDWSKADHLDAARYYTEMAKEWGKEWGEAQREAHLETFGKEPGFADYKISGIGRDEYSESAKDRLRTLARDKGEAGTIAAAHRAAATVAARRHINPGGNPDWMSHRAVTGEDPTDVAFEAGKQWGETGAAESGVSNARVRHYGFMEWYNHQAPGHLYREGPPRRKLKRSQLEKAFNEGYKIGKERFNATYGGGRKRNPADSAAAADEMYRTFHGTEPTETVVVQEEIVHHGDIAALGDLEELVIVTPRGHKVVLDFTADPPLLCSSADGRQLLLRGGDMSIDLAAIKMNGDEWVKDVMVLGDVLSVTYRTAKTADSGKVLSYEHKFTDPEGMKGGDRAYPVLTYDTLNNRLEFAGGTSVNLEAGIVG